METPGSVGTYACHTCFCLMLQPGSVCQFFPLKTPNTPHTWVAPEQGHSSQGTAVHLVPFVSPRLDPVLLHTVIMQQWHLWIWGCGSSRRITGLEELNSVSCGWVSGQVTARKETQNVSSTPNPCPYHQPPGEAPLP